PPGDLERLGFLGRALDRARQRDDLVLGVDIDVPRLDQLVSRKLRLDARRDSGIRLRTGNRKRNRRENSEHRTTLHYAILLESFFEPANHDPDPPERMIT